MAFSVVVAFWGVSLLFIITPGADWAYAITGGLRNRVAPAVVGLLFGHCVATAFVVGGVGTLVAELPALLTFLTVAGAVYLVWLGIMTFMRPAVPHAGSAGGDGSSLRWMFRGFGVSGLNPKVFLLFLALLPQFTDTGADWPVTGQIILLGSLHIASCAVIYVAVGLGARAVLGTRPSAARVVSRVSGAAMVTVGLFLLVERLVT